MNRRLAERLILLTLSIITLPCHGAASSGQTTFDQTTLDANATLYGNKTANLMELEKVVPNLNAIQNAKTFAVPSFFGLSSAEIIAYLSKTPYESTSTWDYILDQWEQFKTAQPQDKTLLTDDARAVLTNIRKVLEETSFDALHITAQNSERQAGLEAFLATATEQNQLLMVRSTGREDGKELSNAGGNASIASVPPIIDAISKAISEVLVSYASEKSIGQRLVGKDKHLFDQPFMAVLLQVMMGEIVGTDTAIPQSGVMFSPEAEGETPNVVVIQATFGHNEGVVNGLVPVDTYYSGPENIIHPVISIKIKRLAATLGKEGLDFVNNDSAIQRISTIDPETVHALKAAAQSIQEYYGNAVDIEFVISDNTIYLVQARPLEAKEFKASYLKPDFITQNKNSIISVTPVGVGNAAVRIITDPTQLIITDNIRQALDTFLFKTPNQDAVQAIIIGESAPATSHEATQFRRLGKPVLYAQELNTIRSWAQQLGSASVSESTTSSGAASSYGPPIPTPITGANNLFLIDAQRAVIIPFTPNETFDTPDSVIELGWYAHPIAKKVSLLREFIAELPEGAMRELPAKDFFREISTTTGLIDIIKAGELNEAQNALRSLLYRVLLARERAEIEQKELSRTRAETSDVLAKLNHLFLHLIASVHEINAVLSRPGATRLERLYPITFLEALIRQLPEPNRLVNDYSFGSLLKTEQQEQTLVTDLKLQRNVLRAYIVQYAKVGTSALVPEVQNDWNQYLKSLAVLTDSALQKRFTQFMYDLSQLNVVPLWLNTSFAQTYAAQKDDPLAVTETLLAEYDAAETFIKQLQELQQFFVSFNVSAFENPAAFIKQFGALQGYITTLTTPDFITHLESTSSIGNMAALQVMRTVVDSFDTSIKALTGSKMYTNTIQKIEHFKIMLDEYLFLLESWASIPSIKPQLENMRDSFTFANISAYLKHISNKLANISTRDILQLQPSRDFNVGAAALGTKALWERSAPTPLRLEDIFTLIHQNLLTVLGTLTTQTKLIKLNLPLVMQVLVNTINTTLKINDDYGSDIKSTLIGVSLEKNKLMHFYNLPIRNHSCTFQITYDTKIKKISLSVQLHGQARERWADLSDLIYILANLNNFTPTCPIEISIRKGFLSFCWEIATDDHAILAIKYLKAIAQTSVSFLSTKKAYPETIHKEDKRLPWAYYLRIVASENNIEVKQLQQKITEALYNTLLREELTPSDAQRAIRILRKVWFFIDTPYNNKDSDHSLLKTIPKNTILLNMLDAIIKKYIHSPYPKIQIGIIKLTTKLIELECLPDISVIPLIMNLKGKASVSRVIQTSFLPIYLRSSYKDQGSSSSQS